MKNFGVFFCIFFTSLVLLFSCVDSAGELTPGVSRELAVERKSLISDISYSLFFVLPKEKENPVKGKIDISFFLSSKDDVVLDFVRRDGDTTNNKILIVNGVELDCRYEKEHIVVPEEHLEEGGNIIQIIFEPGDYSLNRREDFMYTLLVPDRARTLFPCFDQPDLKATYSLSLKIPSEWIALANGKKICSVTNGAEKVVEFSQTKPIPTYLFAFVAGDFDVISKEKEGRVVSMLHKESDGNRLSQTDDIFDLIFTSLEWLEEYTGIEYPFTKYDIAIVPGFQYGGMEHMGATFYADTKMFLEESATISDRMSRAKLIAHETAHMWFGDFVTMKWFDDVWTKEVFANWFSSQIVSPIFSDIDHDLNFINSYFPASYAEDRTAGANAIRQDLDNLNEAGLLYGNIIYNKSPIVMEKLVAKTGDSLFRVGIQSYLNKYAYSNATWDDLIEILDNLVEEDLRVWSNSWVKEPGMPVMDVSMSNDFGVSVDYVKNTMGQSPSYGQNLSFDKLFLSEDKTYGLIDADSAVISSIVAQLLDFKNNEDADVLYNLIQLYEMVDARLLEREIFVEVARNLLCDDVNIIVFSRVADYLNSNVFRGMENELEEMFLNIVENSSDIERRTMAFNLFRKVSISNSAADFLYSVWKDPVAFSAVPLGERDLMTLSYKLALLSPDLYVEIRNIQLKRIENEERRKEFERTFSAVSPDISVRDSVFLSLLKAENRGNEPLTLRSLALLNDKIVEEHAYNYLKRGLEVIEEIHYTGDIFFPARWLEALLNGHVSDAASKVVADFIEDNEDTLNPLIKQKILQQSHHLFR